MILSSCTKDETEIINDNKPDETAVAKTRSGSNTEPEFKVEPNPYALKVMQGVYDSHSPSKVTLEPTDLYVRFLPKDSVQMNSLKYDYALELFDYPLDIELPEDAVYMDPTIPEGEFSWLYTTVKPDFIFPEGIRHEILEYCYIPEEDESIATTRNGAIDVEEAAFLSLGYTLEEPEPETRAKRRPEGDIKVYDDVTGSYQPVMGVKIRCHRIIKWSTTYTDEQGHYVMDSKFRFRPHYAIVFDNRKGFDIWGNWGPLARANLNMGWHSNKGYSRNLGTGSKAWEWAAVNNAGYDYYKMCEETGISKPPKNLKIWVFKNWKKSSAAMLRRVIKPFAFSWPAFFFGIESGISATIVGILVKFIMPDITIGCNNATYGTIHRLVHHELSHASHFRQVGGKFWGRYIGYIVKYGSYGSGKGVDAQLCGVGEMWGYSMGYISEYEKFNPEKLKKEYPDGMPSGWIKPQVFWDLITKSVLTKKQIYDCLTADVDTYNKLVAKMYGKYPAKASLIEKAFLDSGISPNIPLPEEDVYDGTYINQSVSSSTSLSGKDVLLRNVSVTNKSKLTIHATRSATLKMPFTIDRDSQFEIICGQ